ncbi:MAG TPA: energy transducer TonB [Terriglobales bacterium]|nr:energy transducer TonB [Terriglobales bacterium]
MLRHRNFRRLHRVLALALLAAGLAAGSASAQEGSGARRVRVQVQPGYPDIARQLRLAGTVRVVVVIAPSGVVRSTKVVGGHPVLVQSALDALKKWRFESAGGETVQTVVFNFSPG